MPLFESSSRRRLPIVAAALLAVTAAFFVNRRPAPRKWNVVLVSIDTLRADGLHEYGNPRPSSPALDRLASRSYVFEQAHANSSVTLTSHMSMLTGLYPSHHKVLSFRDSANVLPEKIPTLAEYLSAGGYRTAWFGGLGDDMLKKEKGFGRGFGTFDYDEFDQAEGQKKILGWIDAQNDQPFFLMLHTWRLHSPYLSPSPISESFVSKSYRGRLIANEDKYHAFAASFDMSKVANFPGIGNPVFSTPTWRGYLSKEPAQRLFWSRLDPRDRDDLDYLRASYDEAVQTVDAALDTIFRRLESRGLMDNTVIIVTADHGEEFLDHGGFHHLTHYEEVLRVPLIVHLPGQTERRRVSSLTESVDLLPTVLHLVGKELSRAVDEADLFGPRPVAASFAFTKRGPRVESSYRSGDWKLIYWPDSGYELYDLGKDPRERSNRFEHPDDDQLATLRGLMQKLQGQLSELQ